MSVEMVSLKNVGRESKIELLRALGYDADDKYVTKDGEPLIDKYVDEKVPVDKMLILPGSIVISDNPLSIAAYFEEYGDWD